MKSRLIRESILTSSSLASLSACVERLFYRLLLHADDFGNFAAVPALIRNKCFPMGSAGRVTIKKWLNDLASVEIIGFYNDGNKTYGHFYNMTRYNNLRYPKSSCPEPNNEFYKCISDAERALKGETVQPIIVEIDNRQKKPEAPKPKPAKRKKPVDKTIDAKAYGCADYLKDGIVANKPNHLIAKMETEWSSSAKRRQWASDFEKCVRIDDRTWSQINVVLAWLVKNDFWLKNIESGKKFREKFDRLESESTQRIRPKLVISDDGNCDPNCPSWDNLA